MSFIGYQLSIQDIPGIKKVADDTLVFLIAMKEHNAMLESYVIDLVSME